MNIYHAVMAAMVLCILALIYFRLETRHFIIKRHTVASEKLPADFNHVKLALITDLHNTEYGKGNRRLLEAIDKEKPDYILIAGDMLVGKINADFTHAVDFLKAIAERYPVYYSYGNHECRLKENKKKYKNTFRDYEQAISELPLHMLHNQKAEIRRGTSSLYIYGLEIASDYYKRLKACKMTGNYLNRLLGEKQDGFNILIAHNPFYFPAYAEWGAELVVAGHNHGGIVNVPFLGGLVDPALHFFPEYDKGLFKEKNSQMVLSGGVGGHSPNFRAFNPPELVMITLAGKESAK